MKFPRSGLPWLLLDWLSWLSKKSFSFGRFRSKGLIDNRMRHTPIHRRYFILYAVLYFSFYHVRSGRTVFFLLFFVFFSTSWSFSLLIMGKTCRCTGTDTTLGACIWKVGKELHWARTNSWCLRCRRRHRPSFAVRYSWSWTKRIYRGHSRFFARGGEIAYHWPEGIPGW